MCAQDAFTFRLLLFALDVVWAGWCVNFYLFIYFKLCVFSSPLNNGSVNRGLSVHPHNSNKSLLRSVFLILCK